jgi:hypothetical protein
MSQGASGSRAERKIGRTRVADRIAEDLRDRILDGELRVVEFILRQPEPVPGHGGGVVGRGGAPGRAGFRITA